MKSIENGWTLQDSEPTTGNVETMDDVCCTIDVYNILKLYYMLTYKNLLTYSNTIVCTLVLAHLPLHIIMYVC